MTIDTNQKQQILSGLKWLLVTFFIFLIGIEVYTISIERYSSVQERRILLFLVLIGIFLFKNRYTYLLAITLFLSCLYYLIVVSSKYSDFVAVDFMGSLFSLLNPHTNSKTAFFLFQFPIYFYFLAFMSFTTPLVRKWYKFYTKKPPVKKSYL